MNSQINSYCFSVGVNPNTVYASMMRMRCSTVCYLLCVWHPDKFTSLLFFTIYAVKQAKRFEIYIRKF